MTRSERFQRFLATYWPILAVLPVTGIISIAVWLVGDPWGAGDWGSNVVLALAITVATIILSRKQARLQEDAADLELDEKIAAISGSTDELLAERTASRVCRMINDGKAGFNLIGSGHQAARDSYLRNLLSALGVIRGLVSEQLDCHTNWTVDDWRAVNRALVDMLSPLERRERRKRALDEDLLSRVTKTLAILVRETKPVGEAAPKLEPYERPLGPGDAEPCLSPPPVPMSALVGQYRDRDMRVLLNWQLLIRTEQDGGDGDAPRTSAVADEGVRIERHAFTELDKIPFGVYYTPWFVDPAGKSANFKDAGVEPIRFRDVNRRYADFSEVKKDRIESILRDMDHAAGVRPYRFAIATLALENGDLVVLDGNHRLAAVAQSVRRRGGVVQNVEIVEYRILTTVSEKLLPDVKWHLNRIRKETA